MNGHQAAHHRKGLPFGYVGMKRVGGITLLFTLVYFVATMWGYYTAQAKCRTEAAREFKGAHETLSSGFCTSPSMEAARRLSPTTCARAESIAGSGMTGEAYINYRVEQELGNLFVSITRHTITASLFVLAACLLLWLVIVWFRDTDILPRLHVE